MYVADDQAEVGSITSEPRGSNDIGYDLVLLQEMSDKTFAELDPVRKNAINIRGRTVWKLVHYLCEADRP